MGNSPTQHLQGSKRKKIAYFCMDAGLVIASGYWIVQGGGWEAFVVFLGSLTIFLKALMP